MGGAVRTRCGPSCGRVRCFDRANRSWRLGRRDANAVTRFEVCDECVGIAWIQRRGCVAHACSPPVGSTMSSTSRVRSQPGVLAGRACVRTDRDRPRCVRFVVIAVLQPVQIVRRRGDVQNVLTGLGTTTGEFRLRMLTLIDDARERAFLG